MRSLTEGFIASAGFAGVDILVDELSHIGPNVVSREELVGFVLSEVAG
jgi:hypothetical protein